MERTNFTMAARSKYPSLASPVIESIKIDGADRVFYSPFDMAAGWQGDDHPLSYGYAPGDSLQLGANMLTYCLTH